MTEGPLERPRDLGALLSDAYALYTRDFLAYLAVSAAVVVPAQLIVSGVGLEELTSGYDSSPSDVELIVPTVLSYLVITPLIIAMCVFMARSRENGERPRPGQAITRGLEAFGPLFVAVFLSAWAIAAGLVLLVIPGIYVAVRLYFVPQEVVIDGLTAPVALFASWERVTGRWWRTFGYVVVFNLLASAPAFLLQPPLGALAKSADREVVSLAGQIAVETLTAPFLALTSILLFFDLRARTPQRPQ